MDATGDAPSSGAAARRGIRFWVVRYLPAEIVGTVAMVLAGLAVSPIPGAPVLIAVAALVGETLGFYVVLGLTVAREQARRGVRGARLAGRTLGLLVAEFGVAEVLDSLVVRPAALLVGVWLVPDVVLGLLAGKVVADIVFYVTAAVAYTLTDRMGLRGRTPPRG